MLNFGGYFLEIYLEALLKDLVLVNFARRTIMLFNVNKVVLIGAALIMMGCGGLDLQKESKKDDSFGLTCKGKRPQLIEATHEATSDNGLYVVSAQWPIGLVRGEDMVVKLQFDRQDGSPLSQVEVKEFKIFMSIHGHGGADRDQQIVTEDGCLLSNQAVVKDFAFTMAGPWELKIAAIVDGEEDKAEIKVVVE